jgi:hypothetical protein
MSEKKRAKKDGHDVNKQRADMRENVRARKEIAATSRAGQNPNDHDQPDYIDYKRGSEEDRTMRQGNNSV